MIDPLPVFIGWDAREAIAFDVCRFSLLRHSSVPLHVQALRRDELKARGLYARTFTMRDGQAIDDGDGRPFSTEFSFTRFLVPALRDWKGWAVFLDCDFLVRADIAELVPLLDYRKALMVCRQQHMPSEQTKMQGIEQSRYERKNWSSFVAWNCGHPKNQALTPRVVSEQPGRFLHQFAWLEDDLIGALPVEWNFIAGTTTGNPKAIHLTTGGPWFVECQDVPFAEDWRAELKMMGDGA